jgi:hypothetical protein
MLRILGQRAAQRCSLAVSSAASAHLAAGPALVLASASSAAALSSAPRKRLFSADSSDGGGGQVGAKRVSAHSVAHSESPVKKRTRCSASA